MNFSNIFDQVVATQGNKNVVIREIRQHDPAGSPTMSDAGAQTPIMRQVKEILVQIHTINFVRLHLQ